MAPNYEFVCHCGACTVTADSDPVNMVYCWCDSCTQAAGGAPCVAIAMFRAKSVKITGPTETVSVTGAKDAAQRTACAKCHVKISSIPKGGPPLRTASPYQSKDRGIPWFKPRTHIFCEDKVNSTGIKPQQLMDGLPKYLNMPKNMGGDDKQLDAAKI